VSEIETKIETKTAHCPTHGPYQARQCMPSLWGQPPIWSGCPQCLEALRERQREREAEQAAREQLRSVAHAGIPLRFQTAEAPSTGKLADALGAFLDREKDVRGAGLVIMGPPGVGKTHAVCGLALELLRDGRRPVYGTPERIAREMRGTFRRGSELTEQDVLAKYAEAQLLILDEIGTSSPEHERTVVHQLIGARYEQLLPSIFVSNLTRPEIEDYLGGRAADRLAETCAFAGINGQSRRRAAALSTGPSSAQGAA
jgi:DNA replication protein DnaC